MGEGEARPTGRIGKVIATPRGGLVAVTGLETVIFDAGENYGGSEPGTAMASIDFAEPVCWRTTRKGNGVGRGVSAGLARVDPRGRLLD